MKLIILVLIFFTMSFTLAAQNVGIGETLPTAMKLQVKSADSAVLLIQNSTGVGSDIKTGMYYKTGNSYSGGIATIGSGATFRMGLFTFGGANPSALQERLSILDGGNVGVGTTNPLDAFSVKTASGVAGISHTDGTVTLKTIVNSSGGFVGTTTNHPFYLMANGSTKVTVLQNGNVGILNSTPNAPLSFPSTVGNKIALWGDATGGHYGIGIQGSLMQLYGSASNADIALGYGSSTAFTENMRIKGNGNVGIGTNNPATGGLVVNKLVGNTSAVFGSATTGVSIQASYPGIGFNTYYNGGSFNIAAGGAGYIGVDPTSSRIILSNSGGGAAANAASGLQDKMWIDYDGTVSMGSANLNAENSTLGTGYKLKVFGKIISEEVRVQLKAAWPDYVFDKNYKKLSLEELEKYVDENKHLPNIPSAKEIEKDGQHLGEIQRKMLEKIEELSLYVIELKKEIDLLKNKNDQ